MSTNEKKTCPQPEPVINRAEMVQDDFVQEDELMQDTINDQNTDGNVDKNEKYSFAAESSSTGFQMPANFDLPDEIIQEQLPAAKVPFIYYVSTIFYQPQHFHKFFEHFSFCLLKISNYSIKFLSKCNVEKESLSFWRKKNQQLEFKLSFVP